jgi:hypothetical protein
VKEELLSRNPTVIDLIDQIKKSKKVNAYAYAVVASLQGN